MKCRLLSRRHLLGALAASSMLAAAGPANAKASAPDILLVVLDDVGFSDLGSFGGEIRTPALDALAAGGLRYNRFDTRAVCAATRAALLTGRNNQSVGMSNLPSEAAVRPAGDTSPERGEMPRNAETLAQALQKRGYATWAIGKWHLAPKYDAPPAGPGWSWPLQRGFDHFFGFISGWTDQYKPQLVADNAAILTPGRPGYHLSEDLADRAIAAFDAQPAGKPAFVYLAFGAAHSPIQVPRRYIDAYAGIYERGWDALREERFGRQKAFGVIPAGTQLPPRDAGDAAWAGLSPMQRRVYARFMATYAGFITHTDEQIGRIVAHLKRTGRYDNTLIVILSDNGPASEGQGTGGFRTAYFDKTTLAEMDANLDELGSPGTQAIYQRPWAYLGATPFRRYKLWPYSGGIRAPLIVSWPGHLRGAGAIRTQPVDAIDLAPTLLEAAGGQFSASINGKIQWPIAGKSILATFASPTAPTRSVQFFSYAGNRAIRSGKWQAVSVERCEGDSGETRWQLFDTARDFAQARDIAGANPAVAARMERLWRSETDKWVGQPLASPAGTMCRYWYRFSDDYASR